ncbi:GNAT family N-acetyltransferase [Sphingobacteriaceae bacterium]|nr:GNAT family N-acetyltransferase [Sphingobacteriaceae bacterium]
MFSPDAFSTSIRLEDDAVLLRPLEFTDYDNLLEFSLNEPEIWYYSLVQAGGKDNLKHYIALALEAKSAKREYPFIVFDKRQQKFAGSTRFYDIQMTNKSLQLGFTWYGKNFRGTGLNKHCKFLMLDFAFNTLQIERVEFRADNNNATSIAAMKSLGCTVEGILRSSGPDGRGGRRDSIVLSILKSEWENDLREKLRNKLV